ncbi:F-box/kelch-repeat protein At3g06240-like [Abrus precatorius]|uniref:F-box/kelch-repeat protein At3g06240-like n=1 Tax=Abrus precatorius TaxID=3816 RepID=A0A8B8L7I2_ABRPR|nr:F-box/kelch-repeat protein At3g06240-like [Abrus precatorius]
MKKEKNRAHTLTLPHELIVEILLRLPVISLLRFKSVCKSWLSLISNPQFAKSQFDLAAPQTHRLLLRSTHFYIESIDVDASLHDDSAIAYLPLPLPSPPTPRRREYAIDRSRENHEILGSCRGLILLHYENGDLFVWNPSTGIYRRMSHSYCDLTYEFLYGFVYDASIDDYLLILIELYNPEVIASGWPTRIECISFRTDSWNRVEDVNGRYKDLGYEFRGGSLLNGVLHWLVFSEDKRVPLIICFGLVDRTLSEIPLPLDLTVQTKYELYSLRVLGGCLSVCCSVHGCDRDEIWVMKEYKVQSSWTKSFGMYTYDIPHNHFSPICVTKDGGIFGSNFCGRLEKLNDKGEILEHLTYRRSKGLYGGNLQFALYRESLLPLPSVIGRK